MNLSALVTAYETFKNVDAATLHVPTVAKAASVLGFNMSPAMINGLQKLLSGAPAGMSLSDFVSSGQFLENLTATGTEVTQSIRQPRRIRHTCVMCHNVEEVPAGPHRCISCDFLQLVHKENK